MNTNTAKRIISALTAVLMFVGMPSAAVYADDADTSVFADDMSGAYTEGEYLSKSDVDTKKADGTFPTAATTEILAANGEYAWKLYHSISGAAHWDEDAHIGKAMHMYGRGGSMSSLLYPQLRSDDGNYTTNLPSGKDGMFVQNVKFRMARLNGGDITGIKLLNSNVTSGAHLRFGFLGAQSTNVTEGCLIYDGTDNPPDVQPATAKAKDHYPFFAVHNGSSVAVKAIATNMIQSNANTDGTGKSANYTDWDITFDGDTVYWTVTAYYNAGKANESTRTWSASYTGDEILEYQKKSVYPAEFFRVSWTDIEAEEKGYALKPNTGVVFNNFSLTQRYNAGRPYLDIGEPKDVMYHNIAGTAESGTVALSMTAPVRRIHAPSLAGADVTLEMSADGINFDTIEAKFDSNGRWLNRQTDDEYGFVRFAAEVTDAKIYTDVTQDTKIVLPMGTKIKLLDRLEREFCRPETAWTSSQPDAVSVDSGEVTAVKKGTAVVSAQYGNNVSVTVEVIDELDYAVKYGWLKQFLEEKQPIISALNAAIAEKDNAKLDEVFTGSSGATFGSMTCIDTAPIFGLKGESDDEYQKYLARFMTYPQFGCGSEEDIRYLQKVLADEIKVGELCNAESAGQIEAAVEKDNSTFGFDTQNKYFPDMKDTIYQMLCGTEFLNLADARERFNNALVMSNFSSADTAAYVQTLVDDLAAEIGYDADKYAKIKDKFALAAYLHKNRADIANTAALCSYINGYTEPDSDDSKDDNKTSQRPGRGSGGGGGGVSLPKTEPADTAKPGTISEAKQIFGDVPTDFWGYEPIRYLSAKRAVGGDGSGNFYPNNAVTRAEFVKMLLVSFGCEITVLPEDAEIPFADVSRESWYCDYIITAHELGVLRGSLGLANPDGYITREEMAAMVIRLAESMDISFEAAAEPVVFGDKAEISDWAFSAVAKLQLAGVISGKEQGMFAPKATATRAETARIIYGACTAKHKQAADE